MKVNQIELSNPEKVNAIDQKYCFLKNVGSGGMGCIDLIQDNRSLRKIVKKTLATHLDQDPESIIRFINEAQITAQLQHPNIIPVYELSVTDKEYAYTMKKVEGESLAEIINKLSKGEKQYLKKYSLIKLLEIFAKVCNAMEYACSKKVLHRDIKPENIMVGDFGDVLLIDWGLAKILDNKEEAQEPVSINSFRYQSHLNLTNAKGCIGTPVFMPPERLLQTSDEKGEVYSLGAVLYNILNLKPPSVGENLEQILMNKMDGVLPDFSSSIPHSVNSEIPLQLIMVTKKSLAAEPENRYSTVKELREDIERWLNGFPISIEESTISLQLSLFYRRHKKDLNLAFSCIVILTILGLFFTIELKDSISTTNKTTAEALTLTEAAKQNASELALQKEKLSSKIKELRETTTSLYQNAINLRQEFKISKALETIDTAIEINPLPEYHFLKACLLQSLGKHEKAAEILKFLTKSNPQEESYQSAKKNSEIFMEFSKGKPKLQSSLFFYNQLMSSDRIAEAIFVLNQLPQKSIDKELREAWIQYLKNGPIGKLLSLQPARLKISAGLFNLNLSESKILDLNPIKNMPIEILNLSGSLVSDIDPLEKMKYLHTLRINDCNISDLTPLRNLPITSFSATNCPLKNLDGLQDKSFYSLALESRKLYDLSGLKGSKVHNMTLRAPVKNFKTLKGVKVRTLNAKYSTKLEDLMGLETKYLEELNIAKTKIRSLWPLQGGKLTSLNISHTLISDLSPLLSHPLKSLNMYSTRILDISVLKGMPLESLFMRRCTSIKDLSIIKHLKSLHTIQLTNSGLDISFMKQLPSIQRIGYESIMQVDKFWKLYSEHNLIQ